MPDSASRAAANVCIVSSMLNRLCSLPRVTTSQEESTRLRIRWAAAGPASLTAWASASVNGPANTLSTPSQPLLLGLEQVVAGPDHVNQPPSPGRRGAG